MEGRKGKKKAGGGGEGKRERRKEMSSTLWFIFWEPAEAVVGPAWSQEPGTQSESPAGNVWTITATSQGVSWQEVKTWDSYPGTPIWDMGVPNVILTDASQLSTPNF